MVLSPIKIDPITGNPSFDKDVWSQLTGTILSGQTAVIDSIDRSEFLSLTYQVSFLGDTLDNVKSLSIRVQQFASTLREQVFGKMGNLSISIDTNLNGQDFELIATNNEAFDVEYCLAILNN